MEFSRTSAGIIAKYLFYNEVVVWVEGRIDVPFYRHILSNMYCRLEVAGGKQECLKLAAAIIEHNYPYIVIIDGDYDILEQRRSKHRRIILLYRYSVENYLLEANAITHVYCDYNGSNPSECILEPPIEEVLERLEEGLKGLVILDIAHNRANTDHKILPDSIEAVLDDSQSLKLSQERIKALEEQFRTLVNEDNIVEAERLLEEFLSHHRFCDILKGHFVFSIIRNRIIYGVGQLRGHKPNVDNDSLFQILSSKIWSEVPSNDHRSLKKRLREAVREAEKLKLIS